MIRGWVTSQSSELHDQPGGRGRNCGSINELWQLKSPVISWTDWNSIARGCRVEVDLASWISDVLLILYQSERGLAGVQKRMFGYRSSRQKTWHGIRRMDSTWKWPLLLESRAWTRKDLDMKVIYRCNGTALEPHLLSTAGPKELSFC